MEQDRAVSAYASELQPKYRQFASKVQELIITILKANSIVPHSVTCREKSVESLKEKITRSGKSYYHPLDEITDLAGVRIITYFPKDVDAIVPVLEKEFSIDKENSADKRQSNDPSAFGYASVHLVVQLSKERLALTEYMAYTDMKCEIQVRTILQHAWAEIEHDIIYKSNEEIPSQLRRKFASLAGLLEVADREFEMLRHEESKVREHISKTITSDNLDIPVDLDSVRAYLKKYYSITDSSNHVPSSIISLLSACNVKTIREFHNILIKSNFSEYKSVEKEIKEICASAPKCLISFALAVGKSFNKSNKEIGRLIRCPALLDPEGYREMKSSHKNWALSRELSKKLVVKDAVSIKPRNNDSALFK
jgi:ppGpp synthetase/RelA/SpoT-type nucleotidyltranferase